MSQKIRLLHMSKGEQRTQKTWRYTYTLRYEALSDIICVLVSESV